MSPQVAADLLVPADAPVDRLDADVQLPRLLQCSRYLLRAPAPAQQDRYPRHVLCAELRPSSAASPPRRGVAVGLLGSIVPVMRGRIAPKLTPDRARVSLQQPCDVGLRTSGHSVCRYAVSFFLGELVVLTHVCNLLLAG